MSWIGRVFGTVPGEEREGIHLDTSQPYWELDGADTFHEVFRALTGWLPESTILYFEGGSPDAEIEHFVAAHSVPEVAHVAMGTIWPRPRVFHVPASTANLTELARIMQRHAEPELAIHFHVYRGESVLLEWHDAFAQPMLVSGSIPEEEVRVLAERMRTGFRRSG